MGKPVVGSMTSLSIVAPPTTRVNSKGGCGASLDSLAATRPYQECAHLRACVAGTEGGIVDTYGDMSKTILRSHGVC